MEVLIMRFEVDKTLPELLHVYEGEELISSGNVMYYIGVRDECNKLKEENKRLKDSLKTAQDFREEDEKHAKEAE
jgi:hypothetical protein